MPNYNEVRYLADGIGYFPEMPKNIIHGFSWGKRFGNMSFQVGNQDRVLTDMGEYLSVLELGRLADTVNIAAEHSDRIITVDQTLIDRLALNDFGKEVVCDAIFTRLTNVTLLLKPGDCVGLLIYVESATGSVFGIVHAGWRGIDLGLPRKVISYLISEYGVDVRSIRIGVTPYLMASGMVWQNIDGLTNPANWGSGLAKDESGYRLNMGKAVMDQLLGVGLDDNQIEVYRVDTFQAALSGDSFSHMASKSNPNIGEGRFVLGVRMKA